MNKQEAIEAMKAGNKLTHRHFSRNEWVTSNAGGNIYEFEDGVKCTAEMFWMDRSKLGFEKDWDIFKPDDRK